MHPSLFLAALCLGIASAAPQFDQSLDARWTRWKAANGKLYTKDEEEWRRAVWEKNMKMIDQHNEEYRQGKHSFMLAMNAFGDLTNEEFKQVMNGLKIQKHKEGNMQKEPNLWACGSCWAFSATGALEGQMFRKTGKLVSLSEQNLVDCSRAEGNAGCNGGLMDNAFQYVKDNGGLDSEESYPYRAQDGHCKYKPEQSVANDTGFTDIHQDEESLVLSVATVGPISVAIDASLDTFRFYYKGIYYDPNCSSEDLDHGVLVVGYGSDEREVENKNYWIVKNSSNPEHITSIPDLSQNCNVSRKRRLLGQMCFRN
uniref:Procathepsin L n=1 Tax=Ursus americanus TaxID=9643 RepID=A0A452RTJ5_URSAM